MTTTQDHPEFDNFSDEVTKGPEGPDRGRAAAVLDAWSNRGTGIAIITALTAWALFLAPQLPDTVYYAGGGLLFLAAFAHVIVLTAARGGVNVRLERAYSQHLERLSNSLRELAYRDSLTGLHNHRFFHEQLPHEIERALRYGHELSVVMLDVNRFKEVNDRYGHLMGDDLLAFLGRLIGENVRSSDIAARYGGDEFALVLPETDARSANAVVSKLADLIAKRRDWGGGLLDGVNLSVSYGIAAFPADGSTMEDLLGCADRALYASRSKPISRRAVPLSTGSRRPRAETSSAGARRR